MSSLPPPHPAPSQPLGTGIRLGYGMGSVATGTFGTVPGLLLLPYLTDTLGVGAALAGLIVLVPKAWDVILNPIAGRISDNFTDPRGPRRPFLIRAGVALALCFALLFAGPPLGSVAADAIWVLVLFIACATAYAFFQVPYVAMPAEITRSYDERTRLMTWRVALLAFAIMASGASAPAIRNAFDGRDGYRVMGLAIAALLLIGVLGTYFGTRNAPVGQVLRSKGTLGDQLRVVARARDFRRLLTTFMLQALATGAMLAGVDYMARWVLGGAHYATVLFVCFVGPALLLTPVWQLVGQRYEKKSGYIAASLVLAAGALLLAASRSLPPIGIFLATALVGVGYAGIQMFPLAMLPDAAAVDAHRSGENRVGVYTGVWTAGETLGLALGPGVYALFLTFGNYQSSVGSTVAQPDTALSAIVWGFSLLPAALTLISLWWLRGYRLSAAEVAAAQAQLGEKIA